MLASITETALREVNCFRGFVTTEIICNPMYRYVPDAIEDITGLPFLGLI